jgi:6-phosphogluconolactonase
MIKKWKQLVSLLFLCLDKSITDVMLFYSNILFISNQAQHSKVNNSLAPIPKPATAKGFILWIWHTTGETKVVKQTLKNVVNPSFLTLSKDGKFVYATNEDAR